VDDQVAGDLAAAWDTFKTIALPGVPIDFVRAGEREPGDMHAVHSLTLGAVQIERGYRPRLLTFAVDLPALRAMLPNTQGPFTLEFANDFLNGDTIPELPLRPVHAIGVDFTEVPARSG